MRKCRLPSVNLFNLPFTVSLLYFLLLILFTIYLHFLLIFCIFGLCFFLFWCSVVGWGCVLVVRNASTESWSRGESRTNLTMRSCNIEIGKLEPQCDGCSNWAHPPCANLTKITANERVPRKSFTITLAPTYTSPLVHAILSPSPQPSLNLWID